VVSSNCQQNQIIALLTGSGRDGPFSVALARTLADRIRNKSDTNKATNGVLRALYDEHFLAERVTMAGYRICK